jgi:hypothetical protein
LNPNDQNDEAYPTNRVIVRDLNKDPPECVEIAQRCLISPPSLVGKRIRQMLKKNFFLNNK